MTLRRAGIGFACTLALLGQAPNSDPALIRQRLQEVQARLAQADLQMNALKKRRRGVLVELQGISLQADRARAQAEGARLRRDQTQVEVQELGQRKEGIRQELDRLRAELRRQARWMQALGPWGGMSLLPSLENIQGFLVQGRYLDYRQSQEQRRMERVQRLQGDLAKREQELRDTLQRLAKEEQEAAMVQANLRHSEERMQSFLESLRQDESRQKEMQAELAEEALQLERMLAQLLGKPKGDAFEPLSPFSALRGELPKPVEGTLALGFGEHLHPRFKTKTLHSGLLIAAEGGASVQAVAEGRVVFAEPYQSYGPMVILDHGGGYFSLYTHLRAFLVSKGQVVKAGEQVGSVGETLDGSRLGFEIRQQASPQDPQKWLKQKYR